MRNRIYCHNLFPYIFDFVRLKNRNINDVLQNTADGGNFNILYSIMKQVSVHTAGYCTSKITILNKKSSRRKHLNARIIRIASPEPSEQQNYLMSSFGKGILHHVQLFNKCCRISHY